MISKTIDELKSAVAEHLWHTDVEVDVNLVRVTVKAILALEEALKTTRLTATGNCKAKTRNQIALEAGKCDALLGVLADWKGQPFGMTKAAVQGNLTETFRRS